MEGVCGSFVGTLEHGGNMELKNQENLGWRGRWKLTAKHIITGEIIVKEGHNLILTAGKELVGNILIDASGYDTGLTWCALGSSNNAPALGQTILVNEGDGRAMRNLITSKSRAVNVVTYSTFFTSVQSSIAIEEAGIFGHSTAGAAENSGIIFSRWLVSFDNSEGLYDLTVAYELTIG